MPKNLEIEYPFPGRLYLPSFSTLSRKLSTKFKMACLQGYEFSVWSKKMRQLAVSNKRRGSESICPTRSFWEFAGKCSPQNELISGISSLVQRLFFFLKSRVS